MSIPFIPLPTAALPLARNGAEIAAIVGLYARARNEARWKPFPLSVRQLGMFNEDGR